MATSVEPVEDTDTLSGLYAAAGEFSEALAAEEDADDQALEADLMDDAGTDSAAVASPEPAAADSDASAKTTEPADAAVADPLANAKPFEYTVDGTQKTYEGIKVLTNADGSVQGAIIPPESIKDVQYRLQRGEYLEGQNKTLYGQVQDLDRFQFKGSDQKEYKGLAAVEQQAIEYAKLATAVKIMAESLENPEKLYALAIASANGDKTELDRLARELKLGAREAQLSVRDQWTARASQATSQESQQQERSQVTSNAIAQSVQHWSTQFPSLTEDDKQKAVAYFTKLGSAIVRQATPDEAKAAGVKPGDLIIDNPVIHEWLADRAGLRAQNVSAQADTTKKAQDAARENAARLAASARGTSGKTTKPSNTSTKTKKGGTSEPDEETWAQQKARMQRGEFLSSDDD